MDRHIIFQDKVAKLADDMSPLIKLARMGDDQWSYLESMCAHGGWSEGSSGWIWSNHSTQIKLGDSLVKRGLLTVTETSKTSYRRPHYKAIPEVAAIWKEIDRQIMAERHARWDEQERKQNARLRVAAAKQSAADNLVLRHQAEYDALVQEYLDSHPLEES
jgi:hypothetical protein